MSTIRDVTKLVLSKSDYEAYQKSLYDSSLGVAKEGVLEAMFNITIEQDNRLDKGYMFVHVLNQPIPEYLTVHQFKRKYGKVWEDL